jgi:hypothetical protein
MYIRKEDFSYLEGLCKVLSDEGKKKLMEIIKKEAGKRTGGSVEKINIVDDSIFDERGIEPGEFITRTMIKKAFREAKDE